MMKKFIYIMIILFTYIPIIEAKKIPAFADNNHSNDIKLLYYRSSNLVFNVSDIKTINTYINKLFSMSTIESIANLKSASYFFRNAIKSTQLPGEQLILLRRYAIAMKSYKLSNINEKYLNDIIWWSHVRTISKRSELIKFLGSQMTVRRREESLSMYIEHGMVEQIQFWSKKIKFKKSVLKFDLAIRGAKIIKVLKVKGTDLENILIEELKTSIEDIILIGNKKIYKENHDHLLWLFKQFGVSNDSKIVQEILKNLSNDKLYYNKDIVNKLQSNKQGILSEAIFIINDATRRALDPYEPLDYPNRIY